MMSSKNIGFGHYRLARVVTKGGGSPTRACGTPRCPKANSRGRGRVEFRDRVEFSDRAGRSGKSENSRDWARETRQKEDFPEFPDRAPRFSRARSDNSAMVVNSYPATPGS
jgi:hypothetical protein